MADIVIVNVETGEEEVRPATPAEQERAQQDQARSDEFLQAEADRLDALAKASTIAELKAALGLPHSG